MTALVVALVHAALGLVSFIVGLGLGTLGRRWTP